jgi:hypothetical protein
MNYAELSKVNPAAAKEWTALCEYHATESDEFSVDEMIAHSYFNQLEDGTITGEGAQAYTVFEWNGHSWEDQESGDMDESDFPGLGQEAAEDLDEIERPGHPDDPSTDVKTYLGGHPGPTGKNDDSRCVCGCAHASHRLTKSGRLACRQCAACSGYQPAHDELDEVEDGESLDGMEDHMCPQCGAHPGEECDCTGGDEIDDMCPECGENLNEFPGGHDPDCTYVRDTGAPAKEVELTPNIQHESIGGFDKFMDRTLLAEGKRKTLNEKLSPQRQLARNYQEHPLGKTRINGGPRGH